MSLSVQIVFDCANPRSLGMFWADALRYIEQPPPEGFSSWEELLMQMGVPEAEWDTKFAIVDPDGDGPRVFLQKVPEGKTTKNRVHLDINAGDHKADPETRKAQIATEVARLVEAGAARGEEFDKPEGYWVTMLDPEGNEFCVH